MQQAKELGFSPKGFAFSVGPSIPDFETTLKDDANFVFGGTQWTPALKYQGDDLFKTPDAYNDAYQAAFDYEPAYQSAEATACWRRLRQGHRGGRQHRPDKVRDAIAKLDFTSFYGQIKFDERGINVDQADGRRAVAERQEGDRLAGRCRGNAKSRALAHAPPWSAR